MPIDVDRFETADDVGGPPTSERIVRFLATNDDRAFTRGEIAKSVDADPETVGTNLTRLKDRGLVRHRPPYWAFTDDRDRAVDRLRERYGDEFVTDLFGDRTGDGAEPGHRAAVGEFADRVRDGVGDDVAALYLFGSVARGDQSADSDVDVLAVVSPDADFASVDEQLLDAAFDVQLDHGISVEVHAIRAVDFSRRRDEGDPFVETVLEEGERLD